MANLIFTIILHIPRLSSKQVDVLIDILVSIGQLSLGGIVLPVIFQLLLEPKDTIVISTSFSLVLLLGCLLAAGSWYLALNLAKKVR